MRSRTSQLAGVLAFLLLTAQVAPAYALPSFMGLGDLDGGTNGSFASAVSADGSVVVGVGTGASGLEPFRWTQGGGMAGLGKLAPADADATATGVSSDGSVVVGRSGNQAYRWTQAGMVGLGLLPPVQAGEESLISRAEGVSSDGSLVVGWNFFHGPCFSGEGQPPFCYQRSEGFTWTQAGGFELLGSNIPHDVASGADVIVGVAVNGQNLEAFHLDPIDGLISLGRLGDHQRSIANAVSADGNTVVGQSEVTPSGTTPWQAFRWTEADGMLGLGNLTDTGIGGSQAFGVSGDGSIVVGFSPTDAVGQAFIWDEEHGMRALAQVLEDELGLDLTGWTLNHALDISADGHTIIGWGTNPNGETEAWIATIPEPASALLLGAGIAAFGVLRRTRRRAAAAR